MRVSGGGRDGGVPSGSGALLDIRDLSVEYLIPGKGPDSAVRAVDGVSFAIAPGEVFGLAGESGSGKSTIAHSILRVLRPPAIITGGEILFKGRDVLEMGEDEMAQFAAPGGGDADPPGLRPARRTRWRRSAGGTWRWSSRAP